MTDHPITPPPEMIQQWLGTYFGTTVTGEVSGVELALATQAAQWGADQELKACCGVLDDLNDGYWSKELRAARRPKPQSLKEQALDAHNRIMAGKETQDDWAIVRRALEQLDDLPIPCCATSALGVQPCCQW